MTRCTTGASWRSSGAHNSPWRDGLGLIETFTVDRTWDGDKRDITLRPVETREEPAWSPDPLWNMNVGPNHQQRVLHPGEWSIWTNNNAWLRGQARFTCDAGDDFLAHALEPLANDLGAAVTTVHSYWPDQDRAVSAANALITMWLASSKDSTPEELATAYDTCLKIAIHGFAPFDTETRTLPSAGHASACGRPAPASRSLACVSEAEDSGARNDDSHQGAELLRIANEAIPGLMTTSPHRPRNNQTIPTVPAADARR